MNPLLMIGSAAGRFVLAEYEPDAAGGHRLSRAPEVVRDGIDSPEQLESWLRQHPFYARRLFDGDDAGLELHTASLAAPLHFPGLVVTATHEVAALDAVRRGVAGIRPHALRSAGWTCAVLLERDEVYVGWFEGGSDDARVERIERNQSERSEALGGLIAALSRSAGIAQTHFYAPTVEAMLARQLRDYERECATHSDVPDPEFVLMPLAALGRGVRFAVPDAALRAGQRAALEHTLAGLDDLPAAVADRTLVFGVETGQAWLQAVVGARFERVEYATGQALAALGAARCLEPLLANAPLFVDVTLRDAGGEEHTARFSAAELLAGCRFEGELVALERRSASGDWRSTLTLIWRSEGGLEESVGVSRSAQFKRWRREGAPSAAQSSDANATATRSVRYPLAVEVSDAGRTVTVSVLLEGASDAYTWERGSA